MAQRSSYQLSADARKQSLQITTLFIISVMLIAALIAALASVRMTAETVNQPGQIVVDWQLFGWVAAGVATVIVLTSLWKMVTMGGDGANVARALGATDVNEITSDPLISRYKHIVEEVALGASMPVPHIFVLENEPGINAFAAGSSQDKAAIAVTRGALQILNRDELAAVVAHEFAHIRNLDMRLNLRVIGLIHGLMALYVLGRILMHSGGRGGRNGGAQLALLGIALILLGLLGAFMGRIMQAAISRQREYLADADASIFTGDPDALAGALKKIGSLSQKGIKEPVHDELEEARHMMFSELSNKMSGLLSTHPPLVKRIQALDPAFDPENNGWPVIETTE
ncbi:M48 family metalloprotease [Methylophaga sp.]|uniref:M48 family metalloprotease n=1 Tax=Methylophaga sp. TaxID=2024840 RepID=UPI00271598F4|nr:M48 family metalloprotease [Methylophaga sp.]MDO8827085.1 M48 family metalloprotease [Methylophaga sp.]